jgi:hypothetical protein
MSDPNDMTALQLVLDGLKDKLEYFKAKRKADSLSLKHQDWESRTEMEVRLAVVKAELAILEARLPDLRLEAEVAIDSHIEDCYREIRRLKLGEWVSTGEIDADRCIAVAEVLNECIAQIDESRIEIVDIQRDLDDKDLWKDA